MAEVSEEISQWRDKTGLSFITKPAGDPIKFALNIQDSINSISLDELGSAINVLASWHLYLASEMGIIYARVNYSGNKIEKSKLNMVKPVHDAVKTQIDALKKVYDKRIKQTGWSNQ
jgi:hypothetical protein